ncbi:MAG: hypothetical protein L6Q98_22700 [Anaerolineae bacterium]|nr:hypothetical protein [Anaerolineae bacterium]NUQ05215.1 hypothetical protein [Anaerolineae bacterium]
MLAQIKPLTQEERQLARSAAQEAVQREIGDRPNREYFNHHSARRYPPGVTKLINVLCIVLLLAAFTPSAIRLYVIGSETFGAAVSFELAMVAVGIATVLTAEIGQVVFSLALATLGTSKGARRLLYTSMGIATAIALVGNVQVALPGHIESPFAWLEAIAPPLLVLSTAYVLKEQMLESIEMRHANERAYQEAVNDWQRSAINPEAHPRWMQFYANAIRDALRKGNSRRREALEALTNGDWRALVYRELQADNWYETPEAPVAPVLVESPDEGGVVEATRPLALSMNGNGSHHEASE